MLNRVATKRLYRSVELDFSSIEAPNTSMLLSVLTHIRREYQSYIQRLTVTMGSKLYGYAMTTARQYMEYVLDLLPLLSSLRFFWYVTRPLAL